MTHCGRVLRHMMAPCGPLSARRTASSSNSRTSAAWGLKRPGARRRSWLSSSAASSSAHMIADAGTRNIVLDELRDILDHGAPQAPSSVPYHDYSAAERQVL